MNKQNQYNGSENFQQNSKSQIKNINIKKNTETTMLENGKVHHSI